jgi:hypothetical protein
MDIRILHDSESVYADNQIMTAKELINDFIDGLNKNEENDKDTIEWLNKVSEKSAIELIASIWDLSVEMV